MGIIGVFSFPDVGTVRYHRRGAITLLPSCPSRTLAFPSPGRQFHPRPPSLPADASGGDVEPGKLGRRRGAVPAVGSFPQRALSRGGPLARDGEGGAPSCMDDITRKFS